ncbi:hypothetical protein BDZ90DRAFT_130524 [Jaminaea rosea]|uniref:Uncharacterized protein n=1 Tax=Jaminaea rosea TaxID=1569628 RepID=A0A316UTZ2_9BASI|nr:hypothetical protein BDZ90DRAFT_130524 [Jaminaea rosea]PWN28776.1 hypothetical protein BDZ90DRAFT_130524 [Jaminaea rosea]
MRRRHGRIILGFDRSIATPCFSLQARRPRAGLSSIGLLCRDDGCSRRGKTDGRTLSTMRRCIPAFFLGVEPPADCVKQPRSIEFRRCRCKRGGPLAATSDIIVTPLVEQPRACITPRRQRGWACASLFHSQHWAWMTTKRDGNGVGRPRLARTKSKMSLPVEAAASTTVRMRISQRMD